VNPKITFKRSWISLSRRLDVETFFLTSPQGAGLSHMADEFEEEVVIPSGPFDFEA